MRKYIVVAIHQDSRNVTLPDALLNGVEATAWPTAFARAVRAVKSALRRGTKEITVKIRIV